VQKRLRGKSKDKHEGIEEIQGNKGFLFSPKIFDIFDSFDAFAF
jgi:hypothetical protein